MPFKNSCSGVILVEPPHGESIPEPELVILPDTQVNEPACKRFLPN